MSDWILVSLWRHILRLPPAVGEKRVRLSAERAREIVGRLSAEHRVVHHFVARELPGFGGPVSPQTIAENLDLSQAAVVEILADLEERKGFLVRDDQGDVVWIYPLTVERTPHRVRFESGETLYAS